MALFGKPQPKEPAGDSLTSYVLSFEVDGDDPFEVDVDGKIVVGSGPKCSLVLEDFDLAPRHFIFNKQEDILTLNYLGPEGQSKIGKQKLSTNKMYILEDKDVISCEGLSIEVSKIVEELEVDDSNTEEDEDEFAEDTMVASNQSALEELSKEEPPEDDFDEVTVARLIATETGENERPSKSELEVKRPPKAAPKVEAPPAPKTKVKEVIPDDEDEGENIDFGEDDRPKRRAAARPLRPGARSPRIAPVKRTRVRDFNPPGLVGRLFSVFFSSSIVYLSYQSAPAEQVKAWQSKTIELMAPWIDKLKELVTHEVITPLLDKELLGLITFFFALWFALEIIQALLFGGPLGLLIQGYRDQGGFVGKRIKALVRLPLVLICLALPIFFLPVLWGARPLSDVLTGTKWTAPPTWRHAIGKFILIPLFIALALLSTDLLKLSAEGAWPVQTLAKPAKDLQAFGPAFNKWSTWRILPKEDLTGWRLKADKLNAPLIFEKKKVGAMLSFWQRQLASNPLLTYLHPELASFLEKPTNTPSAIAQEQALKILNSTLALSIETLGESPLTFGPFIKAPIEARREFAAGLTGLIKEGLFLKSYDGLLYLVAEYKIDERFEVAMIPLLSKDGESYVLNGPATLRDDATNIIDSLFKGQVPESWNGNRSREALAFAEIWPESTFLSSQNEEQIKEMSNLLRSLGGEALGGDSYPFTRELLPFLQALKKETQSKLPTFSQFLDKAIQAVEQRDPSFFIGEL